MSALLHGPSVPRTLILLSAVPVLVTSALLLGLFIWSHAAGSRSYEKALEWQRHEQALRNLDWAARFYVDTIADGIVRDPMPHGAESRQALARARAEVLSQSRRFSTAERASHERLDEHLSGLIDEGERVGKDRERLAALQVRYRQVIKVAILRHIEEEEAGSARAVRAANEMEDLVRAGGLALAILALLTAVGASVLAVHGLGRRVTSLEAAAARVAAGDLEGDIPVTESDELGRLASSLNTMVGALRRQRERQLTSLAAIAHDLRNPLSAIRLTTEPLLIATSLPPEPVLRKSIALINRQIERLGRMAGDLLDAASIEAGELKLEPRACDLSAVTREVTELYEGTSPRHELRLFVPAEPVVAVCDPTRIAQVLDNILSNAFKYSPSGGTVEVTLSTGADEAILSVSDMGPGIAPDMFDAIFEPFRRVSPSKDVLPGIGLGLSICRRIAAAHGGRIEVASEPGRGTTFNVHLPLKPTPIAPDHERDDAEERGTVEDYRPPELRL